MTGPSKIISRPKTEAEMQKYTCTICGYTYDPVEGDPGSGVMPGTPFDDVPSDWQCPVCSVDKTEFEPEL